VVADEVEQKYGLWLATEDEIDGISAPASRLAYRRLPEGATGNVELFDIVDLVLAGAAYVVRNIQLRGRLRAARRLQAEAGPDPDPGAP
jgi:hypothetical protein